MKTKEIGSFSEFYKSSESLYFGPKDAAFIAQLVGGEDCPTVIQRGRKGGRLINLPASFDIEVTSFEDENGKFAWMYEWSFGINGLCVVGRTWDEYFSFISELSECLGVADDKKLVVYVHNLSYEFQFFRKRIEWANVFATDMRDVLYAESVDGIVYKCSSHLTNMSLENVGKNLLKYQARKAVGKLDYNQIRHSKTPLTPDEITYCLDDVLVVMCLIQEKIETDGSIANIPLTQTGYARNFTRAKCYTGDYKEDWKYRVKIRGMILTVESYEYARRTFGGGFTHANAMWVAIVIANVGSFDFTSSYPATFCSEKFPSSEPIQVDINTPERFEKYIKSCKFAAMFDVTFENIEARRPYINSISSSKCFELEDAVIDNGRVVRASTLSTTINEIDYSVIRAVYKFDSVKIGKCFVMKKAYLPKPFIEAILELYRIKTELKGVREKEELYVYAKQILNSLYGMCVTSVCRELVEYLEDWVLEEGNAENDIDSYNNSMNRFLFYPWGVWCTSYARRNLFTGILEFGEDFVYSDTDSIKAVNIENHAEYIERYNKRIIEKLEDMCRYHKIDVSAIRPKTIKGKEKPLGVWDYEGSYKYFKTLGAKRYAWVKEDGEISITVSGVNKWTAVRHELDVLGIPYTKDDEKKKITLANHDDYSKFFDYFSNGMKVDADYSGKLTSIYIDEEKSGIITDYQGNTDAFHEFSSIHMSPAEYKMNADAFLHYVLGLQQAKYK